MEKKLIVAMLGSKGGLIEQHNLFVTVGSSYKDPEVIEEMNASWDLAGHLDDAVVLESLPGYCIEVVPDTEPYLAEEERLYIVWIGWYEKTPSLQVPGLFLLDTERHAMFIIVAQNQREIHEKLLNFEPYRLGQEPCVKEGRSHTDNKHCITNSDIDGITEVNDLLIQKGYRVRVLETSKEMTPNEEFHGYGLFSKFV